MFLVYPQFAKNKTKTKKALVLAEATPKTGRSGVAFELGHSGPRTRRVLGFGKQALGGLPVEGQPEICRWTREDRVGRVFGITCCPRPQSKC